MPSVKSSSRPKVLDSSTVMTPSLPTLSIASAISSPTCLSCADSAATAAMSDLSSIGRAVASSSSETALTAASMPFFRAAGEAPAATLRRPSRTSAWASTVAVVVPSPAMSLVLVATSFTSWAPRVSYGASSSTSRAMVTPSLGMVGAPNFLSMTTFRPLGPMVTLTASASALTPGSSLRRASSSNSSIFAMSEYVPCLEEKGPPGLGSRLPRPRRGGPAAGQHCGASRLRLGRWSGDGGPLLVDDREQVARRQNEVVLVVVLDLGAAVLAVEDDVALLDVELDALAVLPAARPDGQDDALLRLLLGRVRRDQARAGGRLGVERLGDGAGLEGVYWDGRP